MNSEALILFLILLLGLVLCSFLGGNCGTEGFNGGLTDKSKNRFNSNSSQNTSGSSTSSNVNYDNYNHYQGSSTELVNGSTYYGEKGGSVVVNTNSDGTQNLQVVLESGEAPITLTSEEPSSSTIEGYTTYSGVNGTATTFYGPNGESASIININNGQQGLRVKLPYNTIVLKPSTNYVNSSKPPVYYGPNGETAVVITTNNGLQGFRVKTSNGTIILTQSTSSSSSSSSSSSNVKKTVYYGANGVVATVVDLGNGEKIIRVKTPKGNYIFTQSGSYYNPNEISNTQYYGSTGSQIQQYNGAYGGSATAVTGPYGNTAYYAEGPNNNAIAGTNTNNNQNYYNTLPPGIPASQIPSGQEDLYILKSQVVPPVCPACPVSTATIPRQEPCPPCEPCGRCPEPAFECKKVPNYNAIDNNYLPTPVLSDFSSFGM